MTYETSFSLVERMRSFLNLLTIVPFRGLRDISP